MPRMRQSGRSSLNHGLRFGADGESRPSCSCAPAELVEAVLLAFTLHDAEVGAADEAELVRVRLRAPRRECVFPRADWPSGTSLDADKRACLADEGEAAEGGEQPEARRRVRVSAAGGEREPPSVRDVDEALIKSTGYVSHGGPLRNRHLADQS